MTREKIKEILKNIYLGEKGIRNYFIIVLIILIFTFMMVILILEGICHIEHYHVFFYVLMLLLYVDALLFAITNTILKKEIKGDSKKQQNHIIHICVRGVAFLLLIAGALMLGLVFLDVIDDKYDIMLLLGTCSSFFCCQYILDHEYEICKKVIIWKKLD